MPVTRAVVGRPWPGNYLITARPTACLLNTTPRQHVGRDCRRCACTTILVTDPAFLAAHGGIDNDENAVMAKILGSDKAGVELILITAVRMT